MRVMASCGSMDSDAAHMLARLAIAEAEACDEAAGIRHQGGEAANAARQDVVREVPVNGKTRGGGSTWQSLHRRPGSPEAASRQPPGSADPRELLAMARTRSAAATQPDQAGG